MENQKSAALFGNNPDISLDERARVIVELNKIGSLNFDITLNEDGWTAQCKEVPGIIAGGTNLNPAASEIENQIRDAIYAAFDVKIEEKKKESPYFTYGDFKPNNSPQFNHTTIRN